jgi:hypothetical protein
MNTTDALIKSQNKGIVKKAFAQMIEDGWYLDNNTVENMNEYFEIAINHLEEVFDGEEELQVEHLGFIIDFLLAIKKMNETID